MADSVRLSLSFFSAALIAFFSRLESSKGLGICATTVMHGPFALASDFKSANVMTSLSAISCVVMDLLQFPLSQLHALCHYHRRRLWHDKCLFLVEERAMDEDWLEKSTLVKFAGFALGILIGGPIGPFVFTPVGLSIPVAATAGSFFGAILGYAVTSGLMFMERRRRDRELQRAADAVRIEGQLPESVTLKVENQHITLEGEVEDYNERLRSEQVISTLPGIKGITNRLRLKSAGEQVTASADEIMNRIRDS